MDILSNNNEIESFLDRWTSKKRNYFESKDNENIKKVRIQLISDLIEIIKKYDRKHSHDSQNKKAREKIEKYTRVLDSIKKKNFFPKVLRTKYTKESQEKHTKLSRSIVQDNLEYIFANMNSNFRETNKSFYEFHRKIKDDYLNGLMTFQQYNFHKIRIRLNLLNGINSKNIESVFQKTNISQEFLDSKEVYELKIELVEKLIKILKTEREQKKPEEENVYSSNELDKKRLFYENMLESFKKENTISQKREKIFHLKWERFQQLLQGQTENLIKENNKLTLILGKHNRIKREYKDNLISKNQFEKEHLEIQLAGISFLDDTHELILK